MSTTAVRMGGDRRGWAGVGGVRRGAWGYLGGGCVCMCGRRARRRRLGLFGAYACSVGGMALPKPSEGARSLLEHGCDAGWSSLVARRAHNPKVAGSNPAPAMTVV